MLTAEKYINLMTHAIGFTPDSRHDLWATLNDAGRALYAMHDWGFRTTALELTITADQDYAELPRNYGGLIGAYLASGSAFSQIELVSLDEILQLRGGTQTNGGRLRVFFPGYEGQIDADDEGRPRAELYPTPSTTEAKAIRGFYLRDWTEIATDDDDAIPDIPAKFERLLKSLARAFAWALENQSDPQEDKSVVEEFARLRLDEARAVRRSSVMTGGAGRFMLGRASDPRNIGSVTL